MTATAATNNTSGRTKKAVVAAALGIALLAGGGGTFAAWNDSTTVAGGSVTAGHMDFTNGTPVWSVSHNGAAPVVITDITTFKMVPGDVVTYKSAVTTDLSGQNLQANLTVKEGSITGTLAPNVQVSTSLYQTGTTTAAPSPLTPANNATYDALVTITLPDTVTGSTAEDQTLNLASMDLTLQQV